MYVAVHKVDEGKQVLAVLDHKVESGATGPHQRHTLPSVEWLTFHLDFRLIISKVLLEVTSESSVYNLCDFFQANRSFALDLAPNCILLIQVG